MLKATNRLLLFFIIFFLQIEILSAQEYSIKGKLVDQKKHAIEFALVTLFKNDSISGQTYTDSLGVFNLSIRSGNYNILIEQFGQEIFKKKINLYQNIDFGILPTKASLALDEIVISTRKKLIERKTDRLIFNVENSTSTLEGDATDVLKHTPGVRLQGIAIRLAGKSTVKIMVNDKIVQLSGESLYDYLKSIPSANIRKIEVITNPPSKYDAEGNSGLINIQLKEIGQNNWNATLRSAYQQATYANFSHGMGISYRKKKFSALSNLSYRYGRTLYTNDINYYYPVERWNNNICNRNHKRSLNTLLNLQYNPTEKSNIGAQYMGVFPKNSSEEFNHNYSYDYINNDRIKYYKTEGVSNDKAKNIAVNLNYNQSFNDKDKTFSIDFDYFDFSFPKDTNFNSALIDYNQNIQEKQSAYNQSDQEIRNYSLKTDFEMPYEWGNLSFGAKASTTKTDNTVATDFYDKVTGNMFSSQNDHFQYTENTQALYFSLLKSLGKKWEFNLGLRAENTQTKSNSISLNQITDRNYFKLFPTVYLSYNSNEYNTFSLNFGRRIGRPGFWELNPGRWYNSPKSYATGNPFLQPSFIYSSEFNYSYKSLLYLSLNYADIKDISTQLTYHDISNNTQIFRRLNYADGKYIGGNLSITSNLFNWWESSVDFSVSYTELTPYIAILEKKYCGWQGYTQTTNTFTINRSKTFFASLHYEYNYPSKAGYQTATAYSTLDIGFKYLTLDKNLIIGLNFEDIFRKNFSTYQNYSSDIKQTFYQYYDTRLFRLSVNYRFGNTKISIDQRKTGNHEEKNRIN